MTIAHYDGPSANRHSPPSPVGYVAVQVHLSSSDLNRFRFHAPLDEGLRGCMAAAPPCANLAMLIEQRNQASPLVSLPLCPSKEPEHANR